MKIFWSWQSDRPQHVCRDFVKKALEIVASSQKDEMGLDESERPELDHDILGKAGLVDIAHAIFEKIEKCAVFVGDLTPVAFSDRGKAVANPNVLLELGYALKAIGPERILLVANNEWGGGPNDLPFDLRNRRAPICYTLAVDSNHTTKSSERDMLVRALKSSIVESLNCCITAKDAERNISGHVCSDTDTSIWKDVEEHLRDIGRETNKELRMMPDGRSYVRVIPSNWDGQAPPRMKIIHPTSDISLTTLGNRYDSFYRQDTNSGVMAFGLANTYVATATHWFQDTGELWSFDNSPISEDNGHKILAYELMLKRWYAFLVQANRIADHFGSSKLRKVEIGIAGMWGVKWPGRCGIFAGAAKDPFIFADETQRNWDSKQNIIQFLTRAYNTARDAFILQPVSEQDIRMLLGLKND